MDPTDHIRELWSGIYPGKPPELIDNFLATLLPYRSIIDPAPNPDWYRDAVVYSLYVDLFNRDFGGLTAKLGYLADLGVTCLWLLPVLDSPMRDAGFDICDYFSIRPDLLGVTPGSPYADHSPAESFRRFLDASRRRGIRVIFDVAINHTSDQHPWFREASQSMDNPYRHYYIWSPTPDRFTEARIIFKGIEASNWQLHGEEYYFHRFFSFQPDLNYRNPEVLFAMCRVLLYWQQLGVDGFRADAIPYLWKEEGTTCENLPGTHRVVKFFRAVLDYCKPGSLLLAEACQSPARVVEYLGNGDECQAAYHFPLMPRIFKAIAEEHGDSVIRVLSPDITPALPEGSQWFTFLRCHDELSLELVYVTEEERKYLHEQYCHQPRWNFREGEGIAARLSELMRRDERKVLLAYSIMLGLPGTPVIYYGDEFGKLNDEAFYQDQIRLTGKDDTRFLVRGRIDWDQVQEALAKPDSFHARVYNGLREMLEARKRYPAFGRGEVEFSRDEAEEGLLVFFRKYEKRILLLVHNLTGRVRHSSRLAGLEDRADLMGREITGTLEPYAYQWVLIEG